MSAGHRQFKKKMSLCTTVLKAAQAQEVPNATYTFRLCIKTLILSEKSEKNKFRGVQFLCSRKNWLDSLEAAEVARGTV